MYRGRKRRASRYRIKRALSSASIQTDYQNFQPEACFVDPGHSREAYGDRLFRDRQAETGLHILRRNQVLATGAPAARH